MGNRDNHPAGETPSQPSADAGIAAPKPCAIVIFGASGDLTRRLLMPALYNLASNKILPEKFSILGVAIEEMDTAAFRERLARDVRETATGPIDEQLWLNACGVRFTH